MLTSEPQKGLEQAPLLIGVKGSLIVILLGTVVVTLLFTIVGALILMGSKNKIGALLLMFFGVVSIIGIYALFVFLSKQKEFKKIKDKNNPDFISNADLIENLK